MFGVKDSLIAEFTEHPPGPGPEGRHLDGPWSSVTFDIVLARQQRGTGMSQLETEALIVGSGPAGDVAGRRLRRRRRRRRRRLAVSMHGRRTHRGGGPGAGGRLSGNAPCRGPGAP